MTCWSSANPTGQPLGSGLTHICSILTVISLMSCYAAATSECPRPSLCAHKHQTAGLTSHQADSPTSPGPTPTPAPTVCRPPPVCLLGFLVCLDSSRAHDLVWHGGFLPLLLRWLNFAIWLNNLLIIQTTNSPTSLKYKHHALHLPSHGESKSLDALKKRGTCRGSRRESPLGPLG